MFATLRLESKGLPFLYQVIPAIDNLTSFLDDTVSKEALPIAVRSAALNGAKILNKYYSKTDDSVMYRAAMSEFDFVSVLAFF